MATGHGSPYLRPDVVLMDVRMPVVDGIEAKRRLLANLDEPPRVLVLTTFENDDYVFDALRAGAPGFLLKRARPDEVVRAIRLLAAGDSLLFPAAIRELAARHAPATPTASGLDSAGLTDREAQILRLMAQGLLNAEISAQLIVSAETVKTHVAHVLAKLDARDRTQAVIRAYDSGFIAPRDPYRDGGSSCCRACIAFPRWPSAGCWEPIRAASSPPTWARTSTSSPEARGLRSDQRRTSRTPRRCRRSALTCGRQSSYRCPVRNSVA